MATYPGGLTVEATAEHHPVDDSGIAYRRTTATAHYTGSYGNSDTYRLTVIRTNEHVYVEDQFIVTLPVVDALHRIGRYLDRIVVLDRIPMSHGTMHVDAPIGQTDLYKRYGWTYRIDQ